MFQVHELFLCLVLQCLGAFLKLYSAIHNKSRVGPHTGAMSTGLNYGETIRVSMVLLLARLLVKSGINPYSLASIVRHQVIPGLSAPRMPVSSKDYST